MSMIKENTPTKSLGGLLACKILGHKFKLLRKYKSEHREYECAHCKKQYTLDEYGYLTPLTPKLRRINEVMEMFYLKRMNKQSA